MFHLILVLPAILGVGSALAMMIGAVMFLIFIVQVLVGVLYHGSKFVIKYSGFLILFVALAILGGLGVLSSITALAFSIALFMVPLLAAILVVKLIVWIIQRIAN